MMLYIPDDGYIDRHNNCDDCYKAVTFDLRAQQMAATSEQIISKRVEKEKEHMGSTDHRHRGGSGGLTTAFLFSLGQLGQAGARRLANIEP